MGWAGMCDWGGRFGFVGQRSEINPPLTDNGMSFSMGLILGFL